MAIYPVKNLKTGEMKELSMTLEQYEDWRDNHPDWDKDWNAGVAGKTYGTPKMDDGFKEVMSKVQAAHPGSNLSRFT